VDVVNKKSGEHEPAMVVKVYDPSETIPDGTIDADVHGTMGMSRRRVVRYDPDMSDGTWHFLEMVP
jgi:hypothetical protein